VHEHDIAVMALIVNADVVDGESVSGHQAVERSNRVGASAFVRSRMEHGIQNFSKCLDVH